MGYDSFSKLPCPGLDLSQPPEQNDCLDSYPHHFGLGALDHNDPFPALEESAQIRFIARSIMDRPLLRAFIFSQY
jgi:hypothetical protein